MNDSNQNFSKQEVSLKEIFFLIRSQFKKIVLTLTLSLCFALIYLIITRPIYTSSGSIIISW